MKRAEAIYLRSIVEQAVTSLDDKIASTAATLFPQLKGNGELIRSGVRINWNGAVKKAAVDLWDTKENNPDNAPTLWADLEYRDGYRIIPETITVTTAFSSGEYGWWGDTLYRSKKDANVYTPAVRPDDWEKVNA
ncbi:MAG: hypothetical protein SO181_12640 [Frisingicoccus sp.]|uniref:hypothetical protein n=1 Tax=Frisingicoccus sp. TaxID=1918627 RepID=UPI002A812A2C|nr:hypothetical protein [Frisingicoccus sp.]MDY4835956.1 hypothetical protein [Frisingicoccus sp.]